MSVNFETEDLESTESLDSSVTKDVSEQVLLSTGIRVGTLVKTKSMASFISRTRPDGLHIIDVAKTLQRIELAAKFVSNLDLSRVVVYSSREYGKTPVTKFTELTGTIPLTGRFMPGTFTNPLYPKHLDPEAVIVTDPNMDQQAVIEATQVGIPVIAICDTDNLTENVDVVIPANNRGRKALAAVMWLLSRSVLQHSGKLSSDESMSYSIEDFETKLVDDE
ncbi:MAG: 30S ribosomal protein S2 [Nitrososphaerales archaeon]|uniref:Small ribosomal subunit protein uS2 n=1 Tax=uncultured marine thaumarchaeote AD1000_17_C04 TaxID=1455895 RepID=A0A075FKP5_9ARCH|nr:ribosomal protein S2 (RP-S2, rpsB) [uncultured marine thaumarchaeote AD1000_17_C04]MCH2380574.1 30S ribosomal protein S2 [Nitrososphaerales archaeon]